MSKDKKAIKEAKKAAWAAKKEKEGSAVINYIFGALILGAIIYWLAITL